MCQGSSEFAITFGVTVDDPQEGVGFTCSLCGRDRLRSVYSLPGDREAMLCATCFFGDPPTTETEAGPVSPEGEEG